jgi:hypothetical protein
MPGDTLVPESLAPLTHAVTIHQASPRDVWPWLVQMGAGSRAGWYSYDVLDNGGRPSATRLVPDLQTIAVGSVMPAGPGIADGFVVVSFERERSLVLGWPSPDGAFTVTWAFVLEPQGPHTRLITRARGARGYRLLGIAPWLSQRLVRVVHYVMQRRQLLGIAGRVETAMRQRHSDESDALLDRFMPGYDVVERHRIRIDAPAAVAFAAACEQDLFRSGLSRAIFAARERLLGSTPNQGSLHRGLIEEVKSLGWGVLAEIPDREIVMGAVTKPWEANVVFQALPPAEFTALAAPDRVKIAWTLRVDPILPSTCMFTTETRAAGTDRGARARFLRYWALVSPGVALIRRLSLRPLKREAERRAAARVAA